MLSVTIRLLSRRANFKNSSRTLGSLRSKGEENVLLSPVPDIEFPNLLWHEYMLNGISKWESKIATECAETKRKFTYRQVEKQSKALAAFLQHAPGLSKGDTTAIILPNVPEYIVALLGILRAGVTVTTINPIYTSDEIKRQLVNSETKAIITLSSLYPTVKAAIDLIPRKIPVLTINHKQTDATPSGCIKFDEACETSFDLKTVNWSMDDTCLLPYSSGTTGLPKGVQLTHRSLIANHAQLNTNQFRLFADTSESHQDVIPVILPMFHLFGLGVVATPHFSAGCKILTVPTFGSNIFFEMLYKDSPAVLYLVPPIVLMMLNNPDLKTDKMGSLRTLVSGAAPLGAADIHRFNQKTADRVHLLQLYGMTELSPVSHIQSFVLDKTIKTGGAGVALPNTLSKFVKIDDSEFKGLVPNETGELFIKGPQVMKGYFNNPEATRNTITDDGWLRTGDIGHYDEDGQIFITDRLKELIKVKGFQVAPAELEELLRDHPHISDAAVIGVADTESGEVPKAFVVFTKEACSTTEDIQNYIASKVVKYKRLTGGVVPINKIPRNASGKLLRKELKSEK